MPTPPIKSCIHASAGIDAYGKVLLFTGVAGSGKTSAVIGLIKQGGILIADDYVCLEKINEEIIVSPPKNGRGRIELRDHGIARMPFVEAAILSEIVFLDNLNVQPLPAWLNDCVIKRTYLTLAA